MSRANRATTSAPGPAAGAAISAWRIRFVPQAPSGAHVVGGFSDPVVAVAVVEQIDIADLPEKSSFPEPTDQLLVFHVCDRAKQEDVIANWLSAPPSCGAPLPTSLPIDDGRLRWRPGRAMIEGKAVALESILAALADFAFHEGRLRELEQALRQFEAAAAADVPKAFVAHAKDKQHWRRLADTIEQLAALRLTASRLEPGLYLAPRSLPIGARRIVDRLRARADIESRLESLSDRLEACEDLYEGAVDRITDHRWYRRGMLVEVAIVILLLLEVVQIAASLWVHGWPGR